MAEMTYLDDIRMVSCLHDLPWNKLSHCNILVAGASGLIGSCLIEVLMERQQRDYEVYAMGRKKERMEKLFDKYLSDKAFHIVLGDVTQSFSFEEPFHYIIHAASGAGPSDFSCHPVEVMKANLDGVVNLIEYGRCHDMKRLLYISSGEVYGQGDGRVFTEDYSGYVDPTNPRSCYPSSKRAAETLCVSYASEYDVDIVIARPCHVYGPHFTESDNRVYAQFIRNVLNNEDIVMKSSGQQFRSWCYVVDCVSALLYILLKGDRGHAYNVADSNSNVTIKQLAEIIANIGKRRVVIDIPSEIERKGYNVVIRSIYSVKKVSKLGFKPFTSLNEGLIKTIDYIGNKNDKLYKFR